MTSKHPRIKKCPCCRQPAEIFARWRAIGVAPPQRLYVWVMCQGTPPCHTGPCDEDDNEAIDGWNAMDIHVKPVIHVCSGNQLGKTTRARKKK